VVPVFRHRLRTLEAAAMLSVIRVLLNVCAFPKLARIAGELGTASDAGLPTHVPSDPSALAVRRALLGAAGRLPFHTTCLVRALAGQFMLKRRGVASSIVLGVKMASGALQAHAWLVTADGCVCGGGEAMEYTPIGALAPPRG
jgi:hypothetical protein